MRKANSRVRKVSASGARSGSNTFPPLTTSLECFVKAGSDREFRQLIYSLTKLSNVMLRSRKQLGAYIGLSDAQMLMITIIAETEGTTVGNLAQMLNVTSQFVTMEIGELVKNGVVIKKPNEADRRSTLLSLTSKGQSLLNELAPVRRKANDTMFRSLNKENARMLKDIIDGLVLDGSVAIHELESPHMKGRKAPAT